MKPEHKKYILENINEKAIKEIAQTLGLKERKVRKFLARQREKRGHIDSQRKPESQVKKGTLLISIVLVIVAGFAVYSNSLNGEFIWDDRNLVRDNMYIRSWSNISKIFTKSIGGGAGAEYRFYRPLQMLTYMVDYALWNLNVRGYHLSNILLHILVALSVFWLIHILYRNSRLALFTSLLFVVHPVHTEAVSYISGRADSLAVLFTLLAFIFYIKSLYPKQGLFSILTAASFTLALLSTENSLILPLVLLLYHYSFQQRLKARQFLPVLTLAFIYILLRFTALRFLLSSAPSASTFWQRLPGFFVALTNYLRLLILPFNLHMGYGKKIFDIAHPQTISGLLILAALLIYTLRQSRARSLAFFSICWFFIALFPSANLYPINAYMAEHWLYLPSLGLLLILANGLDSLYRTKQFKTLALISMVSLLTFYAYLTIRQNNYWQEPITFYLRTLKYAPDSSMVYNDFGLTYNSLGKHAEALPLLKEAIRLDPNCPKAHNNLGIAYQSLGKSTEAVSACKKAIELKPDYAKAYNTLAVAYQSLGKNTEAMASYKKAIALNPDYPEAYYNLGLTYQGLGKHTQALAACKKAIELKPDYAKAYNILAVAYQSLGKSAEAIAFYKKAIALNPHFAAAYSNLSAAYFYEKQYKLAIEYCDKAKELGFVNTHLLKALMPYRER